MPETFGQYLRRMRKLRGYSGRKIDQVTSRYEEAGEGMRVSYSYLSELESGHIQEPGPGKIWSLARCLNLSYEDLMKRAGYLPQTASEVGQGTSPEADSLMALAEEAERKLTPEGVASVRSFLKWAIEQEQASRERQVS